MKKAISLLLASLLLLATCAGVLAEDKVMLYQSNFTGGTDGWVARSMGTAAVEPVELNALRVTGRQSDWNSAGRDFELTPGVEYELSVQVRQDDVDSADFMISVAHSRDGVESYENLAFGTAEKGKWTLLSGAYTPDTYYNYILYVETTGAPTLDFVMRFFRINAPAGTAEAANHPDLEIPMTLGENGEIPSLKEAYADYFDFGACVPGMLARNAQAMEFNLRQFSILTPENELKPDAVLDVAASKRLAAQDETAAAVHFDAAKPLLDFCKKNGVKMHGHVLVWHSQTPEAFFHEGYDASKPFVTREVMLARLENYIRGVFAYMQENYPGVIVSWDVVNEAVDDGTGKLRQSNWTKVVGEDFVNRAFELARKYAPEGTVLCYNDYNTAILGKQNGIVKLLESLMADGTVDGYGFQMHHEISFPTMQAIEACVRRIAALGLRLRVSELDIGIPSASEANLAKQAKMYADIMKLMKSVSDQTDAVQVWGVTDNYSWRSGQHPLLFNADSSPKPAFWAVIHPEAVK